MLVKLLLTFSLKPPLLQPVTGYLEISVFENQRYRPLYKWNSSNLYPLDPTRFTNDENQTVGIKSLTQVDNLLPVPFEWASTWQINSTYTNQDEEGWSYGSRFCRLSAKVLTNRSKAEPNVYHYVRRRLWYRLIRPSESTPFISNIQATSSIEVHYCIYVYVTLNNESNTELISCLIVYQLFMGRK